VIRRGIIRRSTRALTVAAIGMAIFVGTGLTLGWSAAIEMLVNFLLEVLE